MPSNTIQIKRSSVGGKVPLISDLEYGELAVNFADGNLFFKSSSNIIEKLASREAIEISTAMQNASSDWETTSTTVQSNSATEWSNSIANDYTRSNFLPLTGGTLTGQFEVSGSSSSTTLYVENEKVGINTETPNEALTVVGAVSATGGFYDATGLISGAHFAAEIITTTTHNQAATTSHNLYDDDVTGATITVTLLPVANHVGVTSHKKIGTTASVILTPPAGVTIDGASSYTLTTPYEAVRIFTDGISYYIE